MAPRKSKRAKATGKGGCSQTAKPLESNAAAADSSAVLVVATPKEPPAVVEPHDDGSFPSFAVLAEEISKLAPGKKYDRDEAMAALVEIIQWAAKPSNELFVKEFYLLGGILYILNLVKENMGDHSLVNMAASVMTCFTYHVKKPYCLLVSQLIEQDGIHLLLLAAEECTKLDSKIQMCCLDSIWGALGNIMVSDDILLSKLSVADLLGLLDSAAERLESPMHITSTIHEQSHMDMTSTIHEHCLIVIRQILSHEKIHTNNVESRLLVPKCLGALKRHDGEWKDSEDSEELARLTLLFFRCGLTKLNISGRERFESIIPLCIWSVEKFSSNQNICMNGLYLLHMGTAHGVEKGYLEEAGIHKAVGAVLQDQNAAGSENKERARGLIKAIYK